MSESTEFWRGVRAIVKEELDGFLQPTGVTPGVWNGITIDRFGRATFAQAAGAGAAMQSARYFNTTSQSIPNNTNTAVNYSSGAWDTDSLTTSTSPWEFNADPDSVYAIKAGVMWAPKSWTSGTLTNLQVHVSGFFYSYLDQQFHPQDGATNRYLHGMCLIDTIDQTVSQSVQIVVYQNSGGAVSLESGWGQSTYVNIWKIGTF